MDLFSRIKNKALNALSGAIPPLAIGNVANQASQAVQRLQPQIQNVQRQIQPTVDRITSELNNQNRNTVNLIHQGINPSQVIPTRAIQTDFQPQINSIANILNRVPSSITPPTFFLDKILGMGVGDVAKTALDMNTGGAYSPDEQSFIQKKSQPAPLFNPNEIAAGKNLGIQDMLAAGLMSSSLKNIGSVDEILRGTNAVRLPKPKAKMFANPEGVIAKTDIIPRTSSSVGKILNQVENVNPQLPKPASMPLLEAPKGGLDLATVPKPPPAPLSPTDGFVTNLENNGVNAGNKVTNFIDKAFVQTREKLQKVFGKETFDKNIDPVLTKYTDRMKMADDWGKSQLDNLSKVVDTVKLKVGSEEDKLIQLFKKKNGFEQVSKKVGVDRARQLEVIYNELRSFYESTIKTINDSRISAGLKEIPYKEDFLSQIGGNKSGLNLGLDPSVSGEVSSAIFKKQGENANVGAVEAMVNYIEKAKRAGFTDISAKEFSDIADIMSQIDGIPKEAIDVVRNLSDNISGANKTSSGIQRAIEGYAGRVKGSAVVGKASTLVNQGLSLPHGIANAGPINFIKSLVSKEAENASKESGLLTSLSNKIPDNLRTGNIYSKAVQKGGDALQFANERVYKTIWKGIYEKAKQMKVVNPIQWADNETARVLGDRRTGLTPEIYNTFFGKVFSAFTLEQTASVTSFAQNIGAKKWGVVIGTLVAWKIGNELNEKYGTGVSPYIDPIDAVMDTAELVTGSDKVKKNQIKAVLRPIVEALKLAPPFTPTLFTGYKVGENAGLLPPSKDVLAEDPTWMNTANLLDPFSNVGRRITGNKLIDEPLNIASKFFPGVGQAITTAKGIKSVGQGFAESNTGNVMFETPQDPISVVRQALFGPNSTQEARDFFNKGVNTTLTKDQTATYKALPKEERTSFLKNKQNSIVANNKLDSILSGEGITTAGSSGIKDYKEAKSYVKKAIDGGAVPAKEDIKLGIFNNKSASSPLLEERMKVYKELGSVLNSEDYTEEQKQAVLEASGASKKDSEYFVRASKDMDVRLQEILPLIKAESNDSKRLLELMKMRRMVGGKQVLQDSMATYLYENDYISEEEAKAIKSLEFDEVNNKFYFTKSFLKSGQPKKLTYSQAKNLYKNIKIPTYSELQGTSVLKQSVSNGNKILQDIVSKKIK